MNISLKKIGFITFFSLSGISGAHADFFSENAGTVIAFNQKYCDSNGCSTFPWQYEITKTGLSSAGESSILKGSMNKTSYGASVVIYEYGNKGFDMDSLQRADGKEYTSYWKFRFNNGKCNISVSSNVGKRIVTCKIVRVGIHHEQAKDNPEACRAVLETKAEIEALVRQFNAYEPCDLRAITIGSRINKLSTSIKGAGCASKMGEIDRAVKKRGRTCGEVRMDHKADSSLGVRG